jgi:translation elongation factor EF-1beta
MKALEAGVRAIEKDGLTWGGSKLVAVGFGIKKLQINLVIEDDKIGLDDLQEQIQDTLEDYVQSTDIVSILSVIHKTSTNISQGRHAKTVKHVIYFETGCFFLHMSLRVEMS